MLPAIPDDREIHSGEIADYWFDAGILVSRSKPVRRTVALIRENVSLVQSITGGRPVPLLTYLTDSPVPDRETRRYSSGQLPLIYSAMAMISAPGLSQLIMKLVFALKPAPIPVRSFTDPAEGLAWLRQFADSGRQTQ